MRKAESGKLRAESGKGKEGESLKSKVGTTERLELRKRRDSDGGRGLEQLSKGVRGFDGTTFRVQGLFGGNPKGNEEGRMSNAE
jgi:hypothetical protein